MAKYLQPKSFDSDGSAPRDVPVELVLQVRRRLGALALIVAFSFVMSWAMWLVAAADNDNTPYSPWFNLIHVTVSLAVFALTRWNGISDRVLCDLGLFYEVVLALIIALGRTPAAEFFPLDAYPLGVSPMAVGIVIFPFVVPNTRRATIIAALLAASMEPAVLGAKYLGGMSLPEWGPLLVRVLPTYFVVILALVAREILDRLGQVASRARDLGRYKLIERLGRGGMGEVWRARHTMLTRPVAIKVVRTDRRSERQLARFEREAQQTARLQSPHTINIYDFGRTQEDGTFYYVMELLDGMNLQTVVSRFGPVEADRAIHILRQMCLSLSEAHEAGLVHRDVKPANVFVCRYGLEFDFVKVLDFGLVKLAKEVDNDNTSLAGSQKIIGTPAFMAPELATGLDVDPRADVYSLGCVAYWLLTGNHVFPGRRREDTVRAHLTEAPEPPSLWNHNIPPGLEALILKCLQKDPDDRPQSMRDLIETLDSVALENHWTTTCGRNWWEDNAPHRLSSSLSDDSEAETLLSISVG